MPAPRAVIVVPCFDEANRLDSAAFASFAGAPLTLLFVDDGSRDKTREALDALCAKLPGQARAMSLQVNSGKAEAVRRGMLAALADGAEVVGYLDADLATPPREMVRLLAELASRPEKAFLAARVGLLGTTIHRRATRHYMGRVFATLASMVLRLRVYDTQCGAKAFRRTPALEAALAEPFSGRWAFDVELIGRLLAGAPGAPGLAESDFVEVPLHEWTDVPGSKMRLSAMAGMGVELWRIRRALGRRRRASQPRS